MSPRPGRARFGPLTALPHNPTMACSKSKSAIVDAASERSMRTPSDPTVRPVCESVRAVAALDRRLRYVKNPGWVYAVSDSQFDWDILESEDVRVLSDLHYPGLQPDCVEGWRVLHAFIKPVCSGT